MHDLLRCRIDVDTPCVCIDATLLRRGVSTGCSRDINSEQVTFVRRRIDVDVLCFDDDATLPRRCRPAGCSR